MIVGIALNHKSLPTIEELINTLKRSNIPTILIEGPDDVFIYRWLKSKLDTSLIALLPCGGRTTLFSIYDRRHEFSDRNVIYIADRDLYKFEPIPSEREGIIFTSGYCIENDIYSGSQINAFIDDEDKENFRVLKDVVGKWFAFEVQKYLDSQEEGEDVALRLKSHINVVCPKGQSSICPNFSHKISYEDPRSDILSMITSDYELNIRGKQLFQMLSRYMSKKGRFSKFNEKNLIEIALKQGNNCYLDEILVNMDRRLNA